MPTRLHISGDDDWNVQVEGDRVSFDDGGGGGVVSVRRGEGASVTVTTPEGEFTAVTAARGDVVWVGIDGHVFEWRARHGARRRVSTADEDALSPPMSATVVRILVAPGATVATGDVLIALEAMKMEIAIRAPRDGVIAAIHCREGDLVQPGTALGSYLFPTVSQE